MAKSGKAVEEFLVDLGTKLKPLVDKDLKELLRYKSEEVHGGTLFMHLKLLCHFFLTTVPRAWPD